MAHGCSTVAKLDKLLILVAIFYLLSHCYTLFLYKSNIEYRVGVRRSAVAVGLVYGYPNSWGKFPTGKQPFTVCRTVKNSNEFKRVTVLATVCHRLPP